MRDTRESLALLDVAREANRFPRVFTCPYGTDPAEVVEPDVQRLVDLGMVDYWTPVGPSTPGFWYLNGPGILWLHKPRRPAGTRPRKSRRRAKVPA